VRSLDFTDPASPPELAFGDLLDALRRIQMTRWLPMKWTFSLAAQRFRMKRRRAPNWDVWREWLGRFTDGEVTLWEAERWTLWARIIIAFGASNYAPIFRRSKKRLLRTFRPEGLEHLDRLKAEGSGAVILGSHVGLMGWVGPLLRQLGYPMRLTHRRHISAENLLLMRRDGLDSSVMPYPAEPESGLHLKRLHDMLKRGTWVQHTGDFPDRENGIPARFFDKELQFRRAPWVLARVSGAPAVPVVVLMEEGYECRLVVGPPIHVGGEDGCTVEAGIQEYVDFLSDHVRRAPWNIHRYLWGLWYVDPARLARIRQRRR
jgi:lauroyl/myristoyl acyltransferase